LLCVPARPATTPFLLDVVVFVDCNSTSNIGTLQSMSIEHTYTRLGTSKLVTDEVWLDSAGCHHILSVRTCCFFVLNYVGLGQPSVKMHPQQNKQKRELVVLRPGNLVETWLS
jgi:hypothetical protein